MRITDLTPDNKNANRGTKRGRGAVAKSLEQFGAGRSVVIDKDGRLIAGNKTVEQAAAAGFENVIVVQTDGSQLVAVQRTDLSLDDPKARGLAIADNRTSELGIEWDPANLSELASDLDLSPYFDMVELRTLTGGEEQPSDPAAEYQGMPSYSSEDKMGCRSLIVHFRTHADVEAFGKVLGQPIPEKAKYIWYPHQPNEDLKSTKYV